MRYVELRVERNEHLMIARAVPPWEVPVLQLIHGEEKVVVTGEIWVDDRELPDAGAELDRMSTRYGIHAPTETAFAVMVYGQAPKGIETLEAAIEQERVAEAKRAPQVETADDPTA